MNNDNTQPSFQINTMFLTKSDISTLALLALYDGFYLNFIKKPLSFCYPKTLQSYFIILRWYALMVN